MSDTSDDYEEEDEFGEGEDELRVAFGSTSIHNRSFRDDLDGQNAGKGRRSLYTRKSIRSSIIADSSKTRKSVLQEIQKEQGRMSVFGQQQAFFEAKDVYKSGMLRKQGHLNKNWKDRWFVLEDGILEYRDEEGGKIKGKLELIGTPLIVDLEPEMFEGKGADKVPVENCFFIEVGGDIPSRKRQHLIMSAPDEETMWEWIYSVKATWVDPDGVTSIMTVAEQGDIEELRDVLNAGCDANLQNNTGSTAVMYAIMAGDVGCLKVLCEFGADLEMQSLTGNTAIMNAVREEEFECLEFLLSRRADPSIVNDDGDTAISLVVQARDDPDPDRDPSQPMRVDYLKRLVAAGAKLDTPNNKGLSPLMTAAQRGDVACAKILIDAGADLEVVENRHTGHNACMLAAEAKHNGILRMLLDAGASTHHRNHKQLSLLEVAMQAGNEEATDFLKVGLSEFVAHPAKILYDVNSTFELSVIAGGTPAPKMEWRLDDRSLHPSGDVQIQTRPCAKPAEASAPGQDGGESDSNSSGSSPALEYVRSVLTVRNAPAHRSGQYVCFAVNAAGTVRSRPGEALHTVAPRFTPKGQPHSCTMNPGDEVVLSVQVDPSTRPPPKFQWYRVPFKVGEAQDDGGYHHETAESASACGAGAGAGAGESQSSRDKGQAIAGATDPLYSQEDLALEDACKFYCRVSNSAGGVTSREAHMRVNCPPFLQPQADGGAAVQVQVSKVRIGVRVTGTPAPTLQWFSRDHTEDGEYTMRGRTEEDVIVDPSETRMYHLEATNSAGKIAVDTFSFPMEGGLISGLKKFART